MHAVTYVLPLFFTASPPQPLQIDPSFYKTKSWQDYGIYHDQNPALWYMSPFIWNLSDRT